MPIPAGCTEYVLEACKQLLKFETCISEHRDNLSALVESIVVVNLIEVNRRLDWPLILGMPPSAPPIGH